MKLLLILLFCFVFNETVIMEKLPSICPSIITRKDWNARLPNYVDYTIFPLDYVIIHHTVTDSCNSIESCTKLLQSIQNYHLDTVDYDDIGYNFLVDEGGRIYEGRGWHKEGAHTRGYNKNSLGIAFIGSYSKYYPTDKQLKAVQDFLQCGVEIGELSENYQVFGAKQVSATESPGIKLYNKIKDWNHFGTPTKNN